MPSRPALFSGDSFAVGRPAQAKAARPFQADQLAGAQLVAAKLATLEPSAEGTRTLKQAFALDFARVTDAVAKGTMSTADVEKRASQWAELSRAIIPGSDPMEVTGRSGGVTLSQKARGSLEARGDWSLTTRGEAQDGQSGMIAGLLAGKVPWERGLGLILDVASAVPPEGKPQSLAARAAMLPTVRGPQQAFWAAAQGGPQSRGGVSATATPGSFGHAFQVRISQGVDPAKAVGAATSPRQLDARVSTLKKTMDDVLEGLNAARDTLHRKGYDKFSEVEQFSSKHAHILEDFKALGSNPTPAQLEQLGRDLKTAAFDLEWVKTTAQGARGQDADHRAALAGLRPGPSKAKHTEAWGLVEAGVKSGQLTDAVVEARSGGALHSVADLKQQLYVLALLDQDGVDLPDSELPALAAVPARLDALLAPLRELNS